MFNIEFTVGLAISAVRNILKRNESIWLYNSSVWASRAASQIITSTKGKMINHEMPNGTIKVELSNKMKCV